MHFSRTKFKVFRKFKNLKSAKNVAKWICGKRQFFSRPLFEETWVAEKISVVAARLNKLLIQRHAQRSKCAEQNQTDIWPFEYNRCFQNKKSSMLAPKLLPQRPFNQV